METAPLLRPASPQQLKIVLIGLSGAGKTLLVRSCMPSFASRKEPPPPTQNPDFTLVILPLPLGNQRVQLWDTCGAPKFLPSALRLAAGSHAVALLYDATSRASFEWLQERLARVLESARADAGAPPEAVLCANKCSGPAGKRQVSEAEGRALAAAHGLHYLEADAVAAPAAATAAFFAALGEAALRAQAARSHAAPASQPQSPPPRRGCQCPCWPRGSADA
jgi:hypothetical protein